MTERALVVSFGGAHQAQIEHTKKLPWSKLCALLTGKPTVSKDKASLGWWIPAEFSPAYRDSDNFVARHALTFDYDHITPADVEAIFNAFSRWTYVAHTTASHTPPEPRLRLVLPTDRPMSYDEFQAVSRKVAARFDIEKIAAESHKPAQMMYLPTVKTADSPFNTWTNAAAWLSVDKVLDLYDNWTDRASWPRRARNDRPTDESQTPPDEKPGIIGEFCRAYTIQEAIEAFELPYAPTATPDRYTYTLGSRPEGAIVYDDGLKLHSHHDTDPASGQNNAFDLVRLHKFADKDAGLNGTPVVELPSYAAMCEFARGLPKIQALMIEEEFDDLGDAPIAPASETKPTATGEGDGYHQLAHIVRRKSQTRWLLRDELEQGVLAVMAGPRGSYKSTIANDWAMRVAVHERRPTFVLSPEGAGLDRRLNAWMQTFAPEVDPADVPFYARNRRLAINDEGELATLAAWLSEIEAKHNSTPALVVIDTYSKSTPGLDENDNSVAKTLLGDLDRVIRYRNPKRPCTVLLVGHTGYGAKDRIRGASALPADTEAEYIVSFEDGVIEMTRSRFKDSPELAALCYKPVVKELGYLDDDDTPVTSVVLSPVESQPARREVKTMPSAKCLSTFNIAVQLLRRRPLIPVAELAQAVLSQTPVPQAGRDRRLESIDRYIRELVDDGFLAIHDNGLMISLTNARPAEDEDVAWLD